MKTKICLIMVLLLLVSVSSIWAEKKSDALPAESIRIAPATRAPYHPVLEKSGEEVGKKIHRLMDEKAGYRDPPAPDQSEYLVWQDNFEDEDLIYYYNGAAYFWTIPDEAVEFGVRFTARRAGFLEGAWFYWYSGSTSPQATVHVYADDLADGTGYPGTELGSVTVTATIPNTWNYVDLRYKDIPITTTEDFFITYSVATGDTLSVISDLGLTGANRSIINHGTKGWLYTCDDPYCTQWAADFEWCIDAVIDVTPDPWTPAFANTWEIVTTSSHSPTHSQWIDDDPANAGNNLLTSPPFMCPDGYGRLLLSYWYESDLVDGYYPEHDYWAFSIGKTADAVSWHASTYNAYVADSWYCGDETLHQYGTNAIYYLYTPEIDLTVATSAELTCVIDYDMEVPGDEDPPYDGWDVANVQISTDNWATYGFLEDPLNPYNVSIAFAGYWNTNNPADTLSYPGWGGVNIPGWFGATFDLSAYFGETVHIRYALASDPYTVAEGYWVDEVDITVDGSIVFTDYNATNLLPDPPIIPLEELEHNDVTASWTESAGFDITTYSGDEIVLEIRVKLDGDTLSKADGDGFWFDDPTIFGYNLPDIDCGNMFNVIPYPQTVGVNVEPGIVYGNFGLTTQGPWLLMDVVGLGTTEYDYYNTSPAAIATNEYGLAYLTKHPTFNLVAGTHEFKGWTFVDDDEDPSNDTTSIFIEVLPAGQYELGYNSRVWTGTYYTSSYCGSYFTPYADGIFSTKGSAYVISAVKTLLLNMGADYATDTETIEIYEAIDDVTPGNLIYTESFAYTGGVGGSDEWVTFTLTTPQTITSDFFVMISGDWVTDPVNANYYPVFDDMIRQYVTQPYVINTVYGDGPTDPWYHSSGARFVNTIGTTIEWIFPPVVNIAISDNNVVLTWAAVSDATDYKVYRSTDPYTGFTELVGTTGGATTFTDTGAAGTTKYFYRVTAF